MAIPRSISIVLAFSALVCGVNASGVNAEEVAKTVGADFVGTTEPRLPRESCIRILRSIREPEASFDDPAEVLAMLVPVTAYELLNFLRERSVPELGMARAQRMSVHQQQLVLDAFERSDSKQALAAVNRMLDESDDMLTIATAIEIYGAVGDAAYLDRIRLLARDIPRESMSLRLKQAVEQAVESILRRDKLAHRELLGSWRNWSGDLLLSVLKAVGATRDPRGLEFINEVIGWAGELRLPCLSQIRLLGCSGDPSIDAPIASAVREMLHDGDERVRKAALLALGDLEDIESIPTMIAMLKSEVPGERENAVWALRRATGITLNDQYTTWRVWFELESDWFDRADALFARIDSKRNHEVSAAIREISKHYLHRHRLASEVSRGLKHHKVSVRLAACEGLAKLGSRTVLADLLELLRDSEEVVRLAAHKTLVELAEFDAGPDPANWAGSI